MLQVLTLPGSWGELLEPLRPVFRRSSTFGLFVLLATGLGGAYRAAHRGRDARRRGDGRDRVVSLRVPVLSRTTPGTPTGSGWRSPG
jgi:hypothetical protein